MPSIADEALLFFASKGSHVVTLNIKLLVDMLAKPKFSAAIDIFTLAVKHFMLDHEHVCKRSFHLSLQLDLGCYEVKRDPMNPQAVAAEKIFRKMDDIHIAAEKSKICCYKRGVPNYPF